MDEAAAREEARRRWGPDADVRRNPQFYGSTDYVVDVWRDGVFVELAHGCTWEQAFEFYDARQVREAAIRVRITGRWQWRGNHLWLWLRCPQCGEREWRMRMIEAYWLGSAEDRARAAEEIAFTRLGCEHWRMVDVDIERMGLHSGR